MQTPERSLCVRATYLPSCQSSMIHHHDCIDGPVPKVIEADMMASCKAAKKLPVRDGQVPP